MKKLLILITVLSALFTGCLPGSSQGGDNILESTTAMQVEETANIAFHRMEIGKLETGDYTTNVLVDLELISGIEWTLIAFGEGSYALKFVSSSIAAYSWIVSPEGVRLERVVEN